MKNKDIKYIVVDLFCGAGGVSHAFTKVSVNGINPTKVVVAINHDPICIKSHWENHPDVTHFEEDIRQVNQGKLKAVVDQYRKLYPNAKLILWASLECTNFSIAKGGLPRDADSRTLANDLMPYIVSLNPYKILIENVKEFKDWEPLDEQGKPMRHLKGQEFKKWKESVESYGYVSDWRLLNSENFDAYTSRNRFFMIFAKDQAEIKWPQPTNSKKPDMYLKPLKAVKDVLDLQNVGKSIFDRKKPLVSSTIRRITAAITKFHPHADKSFLIKYNSKNKQGKYQAPDINNPSPTITCQGRLALGSLQFLSHYYKNGFSTDLESPCPTLRTKDSVLKVYALAIDNQYGNGTPSSLDMPCTTITQSPKQSIVAIEPFLLDTQYKNTGKSINDTCPTLIARQDKKPLQLISPGYLAEATHKNWIIKDTDCEATKELKILMKKLGICDIFTRMLFVKEMLLIMGFDPKYKLKGTNTAQKKAIGNAVEINVVRSWIETLVA